MKVKSPVYHLYTVNITIDPIKSAVWLDLIPHIHMYIYIYIYTVMALYQP